MTRHYKNLSITANQLLALLFTGRILVSLTYIPALSEQVADGDLLLAVLLLIPLLMLSVVPIYLFMKRHENSNLLNVARNKSRGLEVSVAVAFLLWFVLSASQNVSRFVYFVSTEMEQGANNLLLILLVIFAACYGAYVGMQSLGRVASVLLIAMVLMFVSIMAFSLKYVDLTNFSPIIQKSFKNDLGSAMTLMCNSSELAVIMFISPKVNGKFGKNLVLWCLGIGSLIFSLYFVTIGALGEFAKTQAYPIFAMAQISGTGIFQRLDAFHTSFWMVALFLKTAMLLNCGVLCGRRIFPKAKPLVILFSIAIASTVMCYFTTESFINYWRVSNRKIIIASFMLMIVLVPLIFAFIKTKKNSEVVTIEKE